MKRALRNALLLVGAASATTLGACNAILGVEDVTLGAFVEEDAEAGVGLEASTQDVAEDVKPVDGKLALALGDRHTCAVLPKGTVRCWGDDREGQLGSVADGAVNDPDPVTAPREVGVTDALAIAAGGDHTCIVRADGRVACWGSNGDGELGQPASDAGSPAPVDVAGVTDAVNVVAGKAFSCALRRAGDVQCWGKGDSGQLGNGSTTSSTTPVPVSTLTDVATIAAGAAHVCVGTRAGKVYCWGNGEDGQVGTSATSSSAPRAVEIEPTAAVTNVAAGARHSCAATGSGATYCWGANDLGQLGTGVAGAATPSPSKVTQLEALAVAAGGDHSCAVTRSGPLVCWGGGEFGQIGDGLPRTATSGQASPSNAGTITSGSGVAAGERHSCATTRQGAVMCWGDNSRGQLGNGNVTNQLSPVPVPTFP